MTDSPEIKRLREQAWVDAIDPTPGVGEAMVPLEDAIQAVRDTEARHPCGDLIVDAYEQARREAFREAVEALRGRSAQSRAGADAGAGVWYEGAADFLSSRFLSPDNPEGNA